MTMSNDSGKGRLSTLVEKRRRLFARARSMAEQSVSTNPATNNGEMAKLYQTAAESLLADEYEVRGLSDDEIRGGLLDESVRIVNRRNRGNGR